MTAPIVLTAPSDGERVLAELPADGSPIVAQLAIDRACSSIDPDGPQREEISQKRALGALGMMCCEGRAHTWGERGTTWAARGPMPRERLTR